MNILNKEEFTSTEAWRASFIEFLAAALFVFLGAGSVIITGSLTGGELTVPRLFTIAFAHGLAIVFLAFATANISGGHMNPAVTFAAVVNRKISGARGLMFVSAQLAGAVVGALLLLATIPGAADHKEYAAGRGHSRRAMPAATPPRLASRSWS